MDYQTRKIRFLTGAVRLATSLTRLVSVETDQTQEKGTYLERSQRDVYNTALRIHIIVPETMINKRKKHKFLPAKNRAYRKEEQCTITTHKNLSVKIDYISIVFETATMNIIMHLDYRLTFSMFIQQCPLRLYQARWQIGDIYVSGDARRNRG